MVLPAGGYGPRCSDPDVHKGDGALYCVDGPVTVNLVDAEEVLYWNQKIHFSYQQEQNIS